MATAPTPDQCAQSEFSITVTSPAGSSVWSLLVINDGRANVRRQAQSFDLKFGNRAHTVGNRKDHQHHVTRLLRADERVRVTCYNDVMGCGPTKLSRVSARKASYPEEDEFGQSGDEVNTVIAADGAPKDYPVSPGSKNGTHPIVKLTGSARNRVGDKLSKPTSGPIKAPIQRTPSQIEFFKALDEKINQGEGEEEDNSSTIETLNVG